jgi:hypothetical protein
VLVLLFVPAELQENNNTAMAIRSIIAGESAFFIYLIVESIKNNVVIY